MPSSAIFRFKAMATEDRPSCEAVRRLLETILDDSEREECETFLIAESNVSSGDADSEFPMIYSDGTSTLHSSPNGYLILKIPTVEPYSDFD